MILDYIFHNSYIYIWDRCHPKAIDFHSIIFRDGIFSTTNQYIAMESHFFLMGKCTISMVKLHHQPVMVLVLELLGVNCDLQDSCSLGSDCPSLSARLETGLSFFKTFIVRN